MFNFLNSISIFDYVWPFGLAEGERDDALMLEARARALFASAESQVIISHHFFLYYLICFISKFQHETNSQSPDEFVADHVAQLRAEQAKDDFASLVAQIEQLEQEEAQEEDEDATGGAFVESLGAVEEWRADVLELHFPEPDDNQIVSNANVDVDTNVDTDTNSSFTR